MRTLSEFNNMTPTIDKGLGIIGAVVAGVTLSDVSSCVGIAVAIVTLCMLIPRAILNWTELRDSNAAHKKAREKAKRLLDEAEKESSDY